MDLIPTLDMDLAVARGSVAAVAAVGVLNALKIDLFQTNIGADADTLGATLLANVADYSGYAQAVVTWLPPSQADDGEIEVIGTVPEFRPTDALNPNNVWGLWCRAAVGGAVLFVANFDGGPIAFAGPLDSLILTLRWRPRTHGLVVSVS